MLNYKFLSLIHSSQSAVALVVARRTIPRQPQPPPQFFVPFRRLLSDGRTTTTPTGATADGKKVIQIPLYTMQFTVLFIPCALLAIYVIGFGPDEEQLNERVRAKYGDNLQTQQKNRAMREFFLNAEQGLEDQRLQQVLHGGKGEKKRLHAIDPDLYGTERGVEVKQQVTEEIQQNMEEKKRRRKEKRRMLKQKPANSDDAVAAVDNQPNNGAPTSSATTVPTSAVVQIDAETIQTVATYSLIGAVAVAVGFFAGRRQ